MRASLLVVAASIIALGGIARAEPVAGVYEVKYELAANNCSSELLKFQRGDLKIDVKGNQLTVDIERVPLMYGTPSKTTGITAKTKKGGGHTAIAGMDGEFSVAGRVQNGVLSLVFVGEYKTSADHKSLCTQSWNVTGARKDDTPATQAPPKKK